ncbi:MAG TPA: hypothetical protein VLA66_04775 [Thermoanaerobaculia bacterium]|nr:hypothetical protein [Thermoanaerobaculia bacterium]
MPFCSRHVGWLFRLEANWSWRSPFAFERDLAFADRTGEVRLILERDGRMTVTADYAWNGCSPKLCFFDLIVGTPDGVVDPDTGRPKAYHASLLHDALYQFLPDGVPLTRAQADRCFLDLLAERGFRLRRIYWAAVRLFGGMVRVVQRGSRELDGAAVALEERGPAPA